LLWLLYALPARAESYRDCMERRKELTNQALREEDPAVRAKLLEALPVCKYDSSMEPTPGSPEDCQARRKIAIAIAMDIDDAEERGRRLAAAPRCDDGDDDKAGSAEAGLAVAAETAPEPARFRPFELAASFGFALWSGPPRMRAATGTLWEGEVGYRLDPELSVLAFAATASLSGDIEADTFDATITEIGARVRWRWERTALGIAAAYTTARSKGTGMAFVDRSDSLGLVACDFSVTAFEAGPVRFELLALVGVLVSSDASAMGQLALALRL